MSEPIRCHKCGRREAICTPVIVLPIKGYPVPVYMQSKECLCQLCANAFDLRKVNPGWYEAACDHLRSIKKPAENPFPNDPSFKWDEFIIRPDWEPAPREECEVQFWAIRTLAAKGAHWDYSKGPKSGAWTGVK